MADPKRPRGSSWRSVYDALQLEILSLELSPGDLLDENSLAERFGLSRSPVREALIRLAGEELVVTLPNRSTIVAPLEIDRFPKYVEALDVAQRMNTRLAAELRTEADLKAMVRRQQDFERAVRNCEHFAMADTNKGFHMAVARAGRNPYLGGFYERLLDQGRRMLHLHFRYLERRGSGYLLTDEHNEIIAAIRAKDTKRADELAHAHTKQFRDNFMDFMREDYTSGVLLPKLAAAE